VGDAKLKVNGNLEGPPEFSKTNLRLDGAIPNLSRLSLVAGRDLPDVPAQIRFHLLGDDGELTLREFNTVVGDSDLTGEFSLKSADVPQLSASFASKRLNLTPFLQQGATEEPVAADKDKEKKDKVIPDTPIPKDFLQNYLARVDVNVGELNFKAHTFKDIKLTGALDDGALLVEKFALKSLRGGSLDGQLAMRPSPTGARFRARISGDKLTIGLPAETQEELRKLPQYELSMALAAEGATVREMAAGAGGYLRVESGRGQVKSGAIRLLTNDFLSQLVETVNPFVENDPYTKVKCMTVLAAIENGQVEGLPIFILKSDRLNIFADAESNLQTEELAVRFKTVPQKGLGFSLSSLINPYVMVTGTFADPLLTVDPEAALTKGGLAVSTMGVSVLAGGLHDRFMSPKDPCGHAIIESSDDQRALEAKYGSNILAK
jgi:hypothetical protein